MWNIATDLAINSHLLNELPEGGCFPQQAPFQDYPLGQSAEWYFNKIKNDEQFQPKDGNGQGGQGGGDGDPSGGGGDGLPDTLDDHSGWVKMKPTKPSRRSLNNGSKRTSNRLLTRSMARVGWYSLPVLVSRSKTLLLQRSTAQGSSILHQD